MATRLSRDQRIRAHPPRLGDPPRQAVPAHNPRRTNTPLPRPAYRSGEALETILRGFPQSRALVELRDGYRGHDGRNHDKTSAVVSDTDKQQTLRPDRGASHPRGPAPARGGAG